MEKFKIWLGYAYITIGILCAFVVFYLRNNNMFKSILGSSEIQVELYLFLLLSLLLVYSGIGILRKEWKKHNFKESELLDD